MPQNKPRSNNFDLIRLLCALIVVINHSFSLCGHRVTDFLFELTGTVATGTLALNVFLVISGYLISSSLLERNRLVRQQYPDLRGRALWLKILKPYLAARILRIFPAYWVATFVALLVLGPLTTTLSLGDYFSNPLTWRFLVNLGLYKLQFVLPGVFEAPYFHSHTINGSIWSLSYEFTLYIVLFVLGTFGLLWSTRRNFYFSIVLVLLLLALDQWKALNTIIVAGLELGKLVNMAGFFFIGIQFKVYEKYIPLNWIGLSALLLLFYFALRSPLQLYVYYFTVPYLTLFLARLPIGPFTKITAFGDCSYGIYVYGFMVQQFLVYAFKGQINTWQMVAYTIPITLIIAIASWYLIEKRALALKSRFN